MRMGLFLAVGLIVLTGCATSFTGEAHVPDGPAGCEKKCADWGEDFVGMVAMGEYSDACICHVRGKPQQVGSEDAAAVAGGAAGVMMQMRRSQQEQQQMMMAR